MILYFSHFKLILAVAAGPQSYSRNVKFYRFKTIDFGVGTKSDYLVEISQSGQLVVSGAYTRNICRSHAAECPRVKSHTNVREYRYRGVLFLLLFVSM